MPYGPGKFEGEPASTFLLYRALMDGADDDAGNSALFLGSLIPGRDSIQAAKAAGYTDQEIHDSCIILGSMKGAIMDESEQGFVTATIYDAETTRIIEEEWQGILDEYAEGAAE